MILEAILTKLKAWRSLEHFDGWLSKKRSLISPTLALVELDQPIGAPLATGKYAGSLVFRCLATGMRVQAIFATKDGLKIDPRSTRPLAALLARECTSLI